MIYFNVNEILMTNINELSMTSMNDKINDVDLRNIIPDQRSMMKIIKELVNRDELKLMRKLMRNNEISNQLDTKELNKNVKYNGYHFVKRNGKMTFVKYNYVSFKGKLNDHESELIKCISLKSIN